ncbi:hypothetical protein [Flexibacterium corallicola]|uniref:hypothetical protein n=1 Tax=Flexibacterium corallicola TaxID=3037259 RepID=UPI00286F08E8|nr:hypothetical protein [Pseudovibrio sp. M1P-2-3]
MFAKPSLFTRIVVAKLIGFGVGLLGFFIIPSIWPEADMKFRLAILFWYTSIGAFIGLSGVFTYNPVIRMPMPWWFVGPWIGGWMNFILVLFNYNLFAQFGAMSLQASGVEAGPQWFVVEGAIFGFLCSFAATAAGGEGKKTVEDLEQ